MTLGHILVFGLLALPYRWLRSEVWRGWLLLISSILAIYWLQPALDIRQLDYILPTATLVIALLCWRIVRPADGPTRADFRTLAVVVAMVLLIAATRYLVPELRLTSRPPDPLTVALALVPGMILWWFTPRRSWLAAFAILAIVGIFVVLKYEPAAQWASSAIRASRGQDVSVASALDLGWLGFSYIAFRLIHTLRDFQTGQLPELSLREYIVYLIFYPAYTAGPIDRAERFVIDYRSLTPKWSEGTMRIVGGLFRKFVIADSLALIALNATNAEQALNGGSLWLLVYAYSLRLYFDFSGYTAIAIGLGQLYGITLPENFIRPYLTTNIAAFWQSWHITLSDWVRFYVFSPLSRGLLRLKPRPPTSLILLFSYLATMLVIGLWHGISITFAIWGLWHALGLFIHKLWSDRTRRWYRRLTQQQRMLALWSAFGWLLTFHFVVLGWVWFALPDIHVAWGVFRRLLGL